MELKKFLEDHKDLPHLSQYHRESYLEHCVLVAGYAISHEMPKVVVLAAMYHDIAKPRTQAINPRTGGACFYGHENIEREELAQFLEPSNPLFERVWHLIRCHMIPYNYDRAPQRAKVVMDKELGDALSLYGEEFKKELAMLHECDEGGSVRKDEDLPGARELVAQYEKII